MTENSKQQRAQCHFISNTHWDREWRFSMQRVRYNLVYMLDMLLDIFEKEPNFKSFHLDSQTLPLQDYLEIRPERQAILKKYVQEKKLLVGPWFGLPDEFCVSGESLIRNLLLGHKIARSFGHVSKTGYAPFSFGHISQMPQIYNGFGIKFTAFYRGINTFVAPQSEYIWEGPDGSRVTASRLSKRPRYNIWYIIQRPVYWNKKDVDHRLEPWSLGHGPFRFIDAMNAESEYQYIHPKFEYHKEHIAKQAQQAYDEQDGDWTTPHRFWSAGHDASCPDIREVQMIADCNEAMKDKADVFHSTFADFQKSVCENVSSDLPVAKGEMRHFFTKGSSSELMDWILSARADIKMDNFNTERALTNYAEPLTVFAGILGAPYPQEFINTAYNWLLQNHGHDSIGGCSRDIISKDMLFRSRQSREISSCLTERSLMDIAGSINLSDWSASDMAIVVYNPASFKRSEVISAVIEIPDEWQSESFDVVDENGRKIAIQFCDKTYANHSFVESPNDVVNCIFSNRYCLRVEFTDIPAMGYRTFRVHVVKKAKTPQPQTMLTAAQTMENEYLAVTINSNGTLDILDKKTNRLFGNLGYFRDSSEIGNAWQHFVPPNEAVFTTLNEKADVMLVRDGQLETSFRIIINWALPEGRAHDEKSRSQNLKPYKIVNTVTLRRGQRWVEIVTEVDNTVEDHYLQVEFPSKIKTDKIMAQGQFDVIERTITTPDYSLYDEVPQTEEPMNSFVDITDGKVGLGLLNEGLKGYEAKDDPDRTVCLTLLRAFPYRMPAFPGFSMDYSHIENGSQCPGKHTFRYAVMPHAGDWQKANLWQMAERFNLAFHACQVGPTKHGTESLTKSFLEIKPENLHVSAVKRSESGHGWIVRLFNPFDKTIFAGVRLNGGFTGPGVTQSPVERVQAEFALPENKGSKWSKVRKVTLEEVPQEDLKIDSDGWVNLEITRKKIMTIEFLP